MTSVGIVVDSLPEVSPALRYASDGYAQLAKARDLFNQLEGTSGGKKTVASVLAPLDELWRVIDFGVSLAGLYSAVHPDRLFRDLADTLEQEFQRLSTCIELSRPVYDALVDVDVSHEDDVTRRYHQHIIRDFRRGGVDLDEHRRERVKALKNDLVGLGQDFGRNIREDVRKVVLSDASELEGLPQDYIDAHVAAAEKSGELAITTDAPDYLPFMTYAQADARRLELYRKYRQRGKPGNEKVLQGILEKRHELATTLGYDSWARYVTEDKMIGTATRAREFINQIASLSEGRSQNDYEQYLGRLRVDEPAATEVGDWQRGFIEDTIKREQLGISAQDVRKYFSYDNVRDGLFALCTKLFGVEIVPAAETSQSGLPAKWHQDVEVFELRECRAGEMTGDASRTLIGTFYLDMHPREDKYKHAAAFPIRSGVAGIQTPSAALVCNFPAAGKPMEHEQVETFFHEFGHLLHHLFGGATKWVGVSGFNTEWDFVEVPSQLLEEWAWDDETLRTFAANENGEPISAALVEKMRGARNLGKGLWVRQQMFYAMLSLEYYDDDPRGRDLAATMIDPQRRLSPFDYVSDTWFHLSFGHLDGYSAIYYTYMWSLVIAKDVFSVFQGAGLDDAKTAAKYRDKILAPGGSRDAEDMLEDFLGRKFSFDAIAAWLKE